MYHMHIPLLQNMASSARAGPCYHSDISPVASHVTDQYLHVPRSEGTFFVEK